MKSILTIALVLVMTNGYAQMQTAGGLSGSTTSGVGNAGGNSISNTNSSQRAMGSEQAPTTNDTVRTGQSSATRNNTNYYDTNSANRNNNTIRNAPQNNMNTVPGRSNCTDSSGRSFSSGDAGYTGCINSMRSR